MTAFKLISSVFEVLYLSHLCRMSKIHFMKGHMVIPTIGHPAGSTAALQFIQTQWHGVKVLILPFVNFTLVVFTFVQESGRFT